MKAEERGDLAERLIPKALDLAGLVHGDGDVEAVRQFLRNLSQEERDALPVVLAGLVPVDRPAAELLAHVTWDEHGRPLPRPVPGKCGTPKAYRHHLKHGELMDDACAEAGSLYYQQRNRRRRNERRAREAAARENRDAA